MDRLAVYKTDKGRYSVRPIDWEGIWDKQGRLQESGFNHIAIFSDKEDADFFVKTKNKEDAGMLMILPCQIGNSLWDKIHGRLTVSGFSVGDLYTDLHEYVYGGEGLRVHYSNDSGSITGSIPASNIGKDVFLADQPDR